MCADGARDGDGGRVHGGHPCVVYLGTLARIRRLDFLLRAFALVRSLIPAATLMLVGGGDDPEDEQFLLEEAQRIGIGSALRITGQLPRDRALGYVAGADVCVSPFRPHPILNSTSPTKLVEYMAMGKAVVATDHPEQRSLIDSSGAGRCVPYDEQAFATAIIELLRDPKLAHDMGMAGQRYVLQHRSYASISAVLERQLFEVTGSLSRQRDGTR